ncbi:hypothetical protein [Fannyhessea vaginae]|nr:hypothetical protein [Fannyhessea vaginae]
MSMDLDSAAAQIVTYEPILLQGVTCIAYQVFRETKVLWID